MSANYKIVRVLFIKQPLIHLHLGLGKCHIIPINQLGGPRQDKHLVKWSLMTKRLRTTALEAAQDFPLLLITRCCRSCIGDISDLTYVK